MSKKTTISSVNGKITGKTVTEGSRTSTYTRTGSSLGSPMFTRTSTTVTDSKGNTRTTKP